MAAVAFAPWAFGCVRPWSRTALELLLGGATVLWLIGLVRAKRMPQVPVACILCVGFLVLYGWWMALNAHSDYDPRLQRLVARASWWPAAPGSADRAASVDAMLLLTSVLASLCVVCDLSRLPVWRDRLCWVIGLAGTSILVYGILQRCGLLSPLIHVQPRMDSVFFFSTFNCHGNAGSFINLVLPAAFGLAVCAMRSEASSAARLATFSMVAICLAGAAINVSKAAQAIALLLLAWLCAWAWLGKRPVPVRRAWLLPGGLAVATVGLIAGVATAGGNLAACRWTQLLRSPHAGGGRLLLWRVCVPMAAEAGIWGMGPGTFKLLMPSSPHMVPALYSNWIVQPHVPGGQVSIWNHAHNDYLQTLIEWGWLGAAGWAVLLGGAFWRLARACRAGLRHADCVLLVTIATAFTGVLLHALVDWPFQVASLQFYVAVYLGLAWGSDAWPAQDAMAPATWASALAD